MAALPVAESVVVRAELVWLLLVERAAEQVAQADVLVERARLLPVAQADVPVERAAEPVAQADVLAERARLLPVAQVGVLAERARLLLVGLADVPAELVRCLLEEPDRVDWDIDLTLR